MRRRTRLIAGTFALVAMTSALAETVLASTCVPVMQMQTAGATAPQAPADDCMLGASHDRDPDGENERQCPFGPAAAAQGCAGVASLPAYAVNEIAPSPEGVVGVFLEQTEHDLLLGKALFRPPRA